MSCGDYDDDGLGDRTTVDRIEIHWPSGTVDSLLGLPADQSIIPKKGIGLVKVD